MRTNLFYFKAVSLEFLKALGIMASQVLKHLQETAGDPKLINNVKTFQIHRNQYWNQDVGKKLSVEKKILKFNQELVKSKKSLMQESATALWSMVQESLDKYKIFQSFENHINLAAIL